MLPILFAATLALKTSMIHSIDVHWAWSGLGRAVRLSTHIERQGNHFQRADGSIVPSAAIDAFAAAVSDSSRPVVPLDRIGVTGDYMKSQLPSWEHSCLEGLPLDSPKAKAFEKIYTDTSAIEAAYSEGLDRPGRLLDSYPHLDVTIATDRGDIKLASASANAHMLPIDVRSGDGTETPNYNWQLMPAIDTLLGGVPHNVRWYFGEMDREWIAGNWADRACRRAAQSVRSSSVGVDDVRSVTIDSAWSGLGKPGEYHDVITWRGDRFVRDDGSAVSADLVKDLVDAVNGPHPSSVSAVNAGLTRQTLMTVVGSAEAYLQGAQSDPRVRVAFARDFSDEAKVQAWLDRESRSMHTDDDPSITVRIATSDGTIAISSHSYHLLMLPFEIHTASGVNDTFDARIAYAIAALLPSGAVNEERLELRWLMATWAQEVARMPDVQAAINGGDARTRVANVALRHGLRLIKFESNDGTNWTGEFTLVGNDRLHAEALCIPNRERNVTEESCLAETHDRVLAVSRVPWLMRALKEQVHGYVLASYGDTIGRTGLMDWDDLASSPTATAYVTAHQHPITFVRMYPETGELKLPYSYWLLFPDGTMALQEYGTGLRGFPFRERTYDDVFPHVPNHLGMMQFVGMLIRPDGTWVKDKP